MFVRRSPTGSGATAVQVAEYQPGGPHRVLKHVGSAHSAVELGVLVARAYELIDELSQQPRLDLEAPAAVVPLTADPVPSALVAAEPSVSAGPVARPARDASGRVLGTASRLLYEALAGVYDGLGFDVVDDAGRGFTGSGDHADRGTDLFAGHRPGTGRSGTEPGELFDDEADPAAGGRCRLP